MKRLFKLLAGTLVLAALTVIGVKAALATVTNSWYADGGSYFERVGRTGGWHVIDNEGLCGSPWLDWCSPYQVTWFWSAPLPSCDNKRSAHWEHLYFAQWQQHFVHIPDVANRNPIAPYTITYNGGSSFSWLLDQTAYSDDYVLTDPDDPYWYSINDTWLDDTSNTYGCPDPRKKTAADEIYIRSCSEYDPDTNPVCE